jgi:four helix bundle protein
MDLAEEVYRLTADFPVSEKFNLESQIKRSVVSISSNIAEGAGRNSKNEFKYFLSISLGASYELETQMDIQAV